MQHFHRNGRQPARQRQNERPAQQQPRLPQFPSQHQQEARSTLRRADQRNQQLDGDSEQGPVFQAHFHQRDSGCHPRR